MGNQLKAYVRRTILEAARDYAGGKRRTADSTRSAFNDAMRGTDTGWWTDLIYTVDVLKMSHRYRRDIAAALGEYRDATGEEYCHRAYGVADVCASSILAALLKGRAFTFSEHQEEEAGRGADAACLGLRFAVEWYAGELAREYCPDL